MAQTDLAVTHTLECGTEFRRMFAICERINQMLLLGVDGAAWRALPPSGKGRTIAELFAHIHNVRLMWLESAAKESPRPFKLDKLTCTRDEVQAAFSESAGCVLRLLEYTFSRPGAHVKGFRPNPSQFVAYLITHEAHHRGQ